MKQSWLSYLSLSDAYERKARFIPGVLSVVPVLPVSIMLGLPKLEWNALLFGGVGMGAVLSVLVAYIASACGNRMQDSLWPDWPHDSPTNRWLHPEDKTTSMQQKQLWWEAVRDRFGLDIRTAQGSGSRDELNAVINDAVRMLRLGIRDSELKARVHRSNIDYAFARNLAGLRLVWGVAALLSLVGCWTLYLMRMDVIFWPLLSTAVAASTLGLARILPKYVRKKADHYAESLLDVLLTDGARSDTSFSAE